MEPNTITNGLQWLGGGFFVLLSLIGIGKIVEMLVARFLGKRDKQSELHESNIANQLVADADIRGDLYDRVKTLEAEIKEMHKEQLSQARRDAEITAKNENLEKENQRQETEIQDLRRRLRESEATVTELRRELDALIVVVNRNTENLDGIADPDNPLQVEIVNRKGK